MSKACAAAQPRRRQQTNKQTTAATSTTTTTITTATTTSSRQQQQQLGELLSLVFERRCHRSQAAAACHRLSPAESRSIPSQELYCISGSAFAELLLLKALCVASSLWNTVGGAIVPPGPSVCSCGSHACTSEETARPPAAAAAATAGMATPAPLPELSFWSRNPPLAVLAAATVCKFGLKQVPDPRGTKDTAPVLTLPDG